MAGVGANRKLPTSLPGFRLAPLAVIYAIRAEPEGSSLAVSGSRRVTFHSNAISQSALRSPSMKFASSEEWA